MTFFRTLNPSVSPDATSVGELLSQVAARPSTGPAWVFADDRAPRSAAEMIDEAHRIARWFVDIGLEPGDRIALLTDALEPFAQVCLASALGGFTILPLPTAASGPILGSLIARATVKALLVSPSAWATVLPVFVQRGDKLPSVVIIDDAVGILPPQLYALDEGRDFDGPPVAAAPEAGAAPLALFFNNGSRGRAEAAAVGFAELRAALAVIAQDAELAATKDRASAHGVVRCPLSAVGFVFDLWRPLVLGTPILDLSAYRDDPPALYHALASARPRGLSLAVRDIDAAFFAAPAPATGLGQARHSALAALTTLGRIIDEHLPPSLSRGVSALASPVTAHGVRRAWFFNDMPDGAALARLRHQGVTALRTYQISESAVPCAYVADVERAIGGYRLPVGVRVRILAPRPDGVGEIAVATAAMAPRALDSSRSVNAIEFTDDGFLATGDLGRVDAAGRLHVAGTKTLSLFSAERIVASEELARLFFDGPWTHLVPIPEAHLWPEDAADSKRWVAILHGARSDAARRFIVARNAVVAPHHRFDGLLCSPAPFPLGTHGRLRREALLGALRSAFASLAASPADRARAIEWL